MIYFKYLLVAVSFCCVALIGARLSYAEPPSPPMGYRWVIQPEFSDEFNGEELDKTKWKDRYDGWKGRPPAMFVPEAISVKNGMLQIKNGILKKPIGPFSLSGGAVTSRTQGASFGYYECRARASKIAMSTTFWMSNDSEPFTETDDCDTDTYMQELDILECIGGATDVPSFKDHMHSNTHYRYVACGDTRQTFYSKGANAKLNSPVYQDFHTYGAWWENAWVTHFYANNEFFETVHFSQEISQKPFARPMQINMVTETYDWQTPPSHEDLRNDAINTSYYDWVRSYELIPADAEVKEQNYDAFLYEEDVEVAPLNVSIFDASQVEFEYEYKANSDRTLWVAILEGRNEVVQHETHLLRKGFGRSRGMILIDFEPQVGSSYKIRFELRASSEEGEAAIDAVGFDITEIR